MKSNRYIVISYGTYWWTVFDKVKNQYALNKVNSMDPTPLVFKTKTEARKLCLELNQEERENEKLKLYYSRLKGDKN